MPLSHYGVVIGNIVSFGRDDPADFGHWYHGHVDVATPSGTWTSALDVSSPAGVEIRYRTSSGIQLSELGPVATMADGFHELAHTSSSGAIDYLRSPFLRDILFTIKRLATIGLARVPAPLPPLLMSAPLPMPGPPDGPPAPGPDDGPGIPPIPQPKGPIPDSLKELLLRLFARLIQLVPIWIPIRIRPWLLSDGDNALDALEAHMASGRRAFLFGQQFNNNGHGVHDVHQNQGDPAGSQWWPQNGTWQDGVVAIVQPDGRLFVWQVRFASQATKTDADGHPA